MLSLIKNFRFKVRDPKEHIHGVLGLKFLLIKLIFIAYLSCFSINNANANGIAYTLNCSPSSVCSPQFYTNMWVEPASNSTLFNPTIQVYYDTMWGYIGYKGSITLGSNGNNCGYIGDYRFCARDANINNYGNNFGCNSTGTSCTSDCGSTCPESGTYDCLGYGGGNTTTYTCEPGSYYSCSCPECRNLCAIRICAYQDPSSDESLTEECDDIYNCMDGTGNNSWMPYFENEVVAYQSIWGNNVYFNTDGGTFVGCVDIPIGPYPPPYCDPIIGAIPVVSTMDICEYSPEYELSQTTNDSGDAGNYYQVSTSTNVCELSTAAGIPGTNSVYNIFEAPIVRLYFNNSLNICASNYQIPNPPPTPGNDTCVQISTSLSPTEIWQNYQNLIPTCGTNANAGNCVNFPSEENAATGSTGPNGTSTEFPSGYSYFRAYFNEPSSSTPTAILPYGSDIASELSLYGIYNALYQDIGDQSGAAGSGAYQYTNEYGITKSYGTVYLDDFEGNQQVFGAFIDLGCDPYTQDATDGNGNGTQICVDQISTTGGNTPVGCFDRPWMFPPSVSSCLTYGTCSYDSSVNISQQPRISFTIGNDYTNGQGQQVIPIPSTQTQVTPITGVIGVDILSGSAPVAFCVLDDNHSTAQQASNTSSNPSAGSNTCDYTSTSSNITPCTLSQAELFGAYITDNINYSISSDPNATGGTKTPSQNPYTGGMQYVDYVYCRGATQICLTGYDNSLKNAVAKMVTISSTVNGVTTSSTIPSTILTDRIIPPYVSGETYPLENSQLYNAAVNNYTGSSTSTQTTVVMGYYANDTYIPYSGCTSSANMTCCVSNGSNTSPACTASSSITYPAPLLCTCTNSLNEPEDCGTQAANCTYAFQQTSTVSGQATGYQILGNYTAYSVANEDNMSSPWVNCYVSTNSSGETITVCPATDNYGNPLFGVRELTPMELGLCVELLTPYCPTIDSSDGYTESNGYATWNQTSAGATSTGACTNGAKQNSAGPPTRSCAYQDSGQNYANGCPEYTQAWGTVTNPCIVSPPWWPGLFLAGNPNFLGAIINQFNVAYNYRSAVNGTNYLTPTSANADPFNLYTSAVTPTAPEPWNSCYSSCQKNGAGATANYARNNTNGDQEMLYLTQSQWFDLWNSNDMEWLLASPDTSANDGCYVYSLCTALGSNGYCATANINATFALITPAMKICKYQDNISFALVDLGPCTSNCSSLSSNTTYSYPLDYTNDRYLMQSNIIAYNAYISNTSNVNVGSWCENSAYDSINVTSLTNYIGDQQSTYDTRTNNGIVVTRAGFGFTSADYDNSGTLPTGFTQISTAESVQVSYNYAHYYEGKHGYSCNCLGSLCSTCTGHSEWIEYNPSPFSSTLAPYCWSNQTNDSSVLSYNTNSTTNGGNANTSTYYTTVNPLSIFSNNMNLSSAYSAASYLLNATDFTNLTNYYYTPNYSSIFVPQCGSDTTETNKCYLGVVINSYTPGNSAANPAMFLWSTDTNYNVTNNPTPISYGAYGQPSQ